MLGITAVFITCNRSIVNWRISPALWRYMLKYLEVKYHDVFNLLTNDTGKKKGKIRMMIETRWMVHGCLLYSFPFCMFEMKIEMTLK